MDESLSVTFNTILPLQRNKFCPPQFFLTDKAIVPKSLILASQKVNFTPPFLFQLRSLRYKLSPIICGILNISSQQNTIYLPLHIMRNLGFQASQKRKGGLKIIPIPNHNFHSITRITVFSQQFIEKKHLKKQLLNFTLLYQNQKINIKIGANLVNLTILQVHPYSPSLVSNSSFQVFFLTSVQCRQSAELPVLPRKTVKEIPNKLGIYNLPQNTPFNWHVRRLQQRLRKRKKIVSNSSYQNSPSSIKIKRLEFKGVFDLKASLKMCDKPKYRRYSPDPPHFIKNDYPRRLNKSTLDVPTLHKTVLGQELPPISFFDRSNSLPKRKVKRSLNTSQKPVLHLDNDFFI